MKGRGESRTVRGIEKNMHSIGETEDSSLGT